MARRGCWTLKLESLGMGARADEKDTQAGTSERWPVKRALKQIQCYLKML
jgi:hypothetical protein